MTPSGPRNLPDHIRCTAKTKKSGGKERCPHPATTGVRVCRMHGAGAPQVKRAAMRRVAVADALAEASREMARLGEAWVDVDPIDGLLRLYQEAEWNVTLLRVAISGLLPKVDRDHGIALPEQVIEFEKGGTHVPASVHVLVDMYDRERDRAAKYGKLCIDAGIDERRMRIAEVDAQRLGRAVGGMLDKHRDELTPDLVKRMMGTLGAELRALSPGEAA